jgi:hypothetical protein
MADKPLIKIGFAAPFSGDQAIVGIPMRQWPNWHKAGQ